MLALLGRQIDHLEVEITALEVKIKAMHNASALSRRLATIPGIGPIIALTFAIEVEPAAFESARHLAAWLGLTPREHSTGGRQTMGAVSRAGHERLRALLVTGATTMVQHAGKPGSKIATPSWLLSLLQRKLRRVAAVAVANKMARIIWAAMTSGEAYRHPASAAPAIAGGQPTTHGPASARAGRRSTKVS
jgi:transposase